MTGRPKPIPKPPAPAPKPPAPAPKPPAAGFSQSQQSVYDLMNATLASWGLASLSGTLRSLIVKGDTNPDTLSLALSQTQQYKQRFAGNAIRVKNGMSELTPAQYIAMEDGYRQVMRAYGIPQGFYDSQRDFDQFIGNDLSAAELNTRVQVAHDQYMAAPEYVRNLWTQYYGTKGDAVAAILDPKVATQLIADRGLQVGIGGAAAAQGLNINQQRAQQFQQAGVTLDQARKAYQQISQSLPTDQAIAQRFGTTFGQAQEENDLLLGQGAAGLQRQTLYREEEGLFKSSASQTPDSLGVSQSH